MPGPDHSADLALLTRAARAAGEIARRHFGQGPETWDKGDGQGPVTEADLEIDAMLAASLRKARPDYGWLSEESADSTDRLTLSRVFIIDPIDGTRAFIDGSKDFSHSLAIIEDGHPVAAAVYLPMRDQMYAAAHGEGATLNGQAIAPSGRTQMEGASVLGAKANFAPERWIGGTPPVKPAFRSSLAYRLALVAEGRFDAMVTLRAAWEWDIAAGALLITEAGGRITDRRGQPLRFNNPHPQLDGVVGGTPDVAKALYHHLA